MEIRQTKRFKHQARLMAKQGMDLLVLKQAVQAIVNNDYVVLQQMHDHPLRGQFKHDRELHLTNDGRWLLRYEIVGHRLVLLLLATGTHRDTLNVE